MNLNPTSGQSVEELTTKKQWEAINDHLREMHLWTEGIPSPLSTSPAGRGANINSPVVTRSHINQHNPLYRRSEGDIQQAALNSKKTNNPPQSAPVLPEGYELNWENEAKPEQVTFASTNHGNSTDIPQSSLMSHSHSAMSQMIESKGENSQASSFQGLDQAVDKMLESHAMQNPMISSRHTSDRYSSFARTGSNSPVPGLHSSISVPSMKIDTNATYSQKPVSSHSTMYPLHHQTSSPLLHTSLYTSSPTTRRRSAPITSTAFRSNARIGQSQRILAPPAQASNIVSNFSYNAFPNNGILLTELVHEVEEPPKVADLNDDREYTRVLLQHQRDRMNRLGLEIETKRKELALLYADVKLMEKKVTTRNDSCKPQALPTLQQNVNRLREINRRLKIDCNCMYKEVELFSRDGDTTSDDFYSVFNRPSSMKAKKQNGNIRPKHSRSDLPPPLPAPPAEVADEPKWRCSHCTFDNHAALNKCEMCDFSRAALPGRS